MGRMTNRATLAHRFVFINKRTALGGVTLKASVILAQKGLAAAVNLHGHVRAAAFHRAAPVWIMTIGATHFPFENRVPMGQLKLRPHFLVTLETGLRRFA